MRTPKRKVITPEPTWGDSGNYEMCGWLSDKYGVSWRIVPAILPHLMDNLDKRSSSNRSILENEEIQYSGFS